MRQLGVQRLVAHCLNPACRHQGLIDVSKYPEDTEAPWFAQKVLCAKCGARGRHIDVRPNWKVQLPHGSLTGGSNGGEKETAEMAVSPLPFVSQV